MTTPPSDDNPFRTPDYATPSVPMPAAPMPGGPMPGMPMPGMPGMPQRPGIPHWFSVKVRITLIACVVAALGLGALGAMSIVWIHQAGPPSDGECLYLTRESGEQLAYHRVGCGENSATFKVDDSYRGTFSCGASDDYVRFQISGSGTDRTLCLALNVSTGDCLRDIDDDAAVAKVGCTDPTAQLRAEVVSGYGVTDPEEACGDAEKALKYTGPPRRIVCLRQTGENI
ncbi:hypothetical protein [Amycolatopsis sp. cmx-8-4]|uniref:LppU/SCO3897 family protein n=1 Tax=Amycolatopsis sp. cmx-8-4 TaxID=2790947 RepID=UPI00397B625A